MLVVGWLLLSALSPSSSVLECCLVLLWLLHVIMEAWVSEQIHKVLLHWVRHLVPPELMTPYLVIQ